MIKRTGLKFFSCLCLCVCLCVFYACVLCVFYVCFLCVFFGYVSCMFVVRVCFSFSLGVLSRYTESFTFLIFQNEGSSTAQIIGA